MATARFLLEAHVRAVFDDSHVIELLRPGRPPWQLALPVEVEQGRVTVALVDYVTAQYLVEQPKEGVRLGWETVYSLVRTALEEAYTHPGKSPNTPLST
ncbi:hypothetical protein HMJ29_13140 [Hymenobacter taeanensis]|uniref:Uncharacterized protein n=1 Tax=Hymenobacter taeanensis TaxID=2735321 RepID=A0A6M6BI75_9BACT|nr:hypothetical protein [Hymenobacter taeanensis]QJX47837.1 hypothetical protein HMJ29_13140 [Hymenobacter taeanensis]